MELNESLCTIYIIKHICANIYENFQITETVLACLTLSADPALTLIFQCALLYQLSRCLNHLPDVQFDQLTANDCTDPEALYRGTYVRCYLIAEGHQPIALLNSCIDAAFHSEWYDKMFLKLNHNCPCPLKLVLLVALFLPFL